MSIYYSGVATGAALVYAKTFVSGSICATDIPEFYTNSLANVSPISRLQTLAFPRI